MTTTTEYTTISISQDNVWAGSGKLIDGTISDCGAQFGADQDESENVYELIEEAIAEGKDSFKIELSDRDDAVTITWSIVEPTIPLSTFRITERDDETDELMRVIYDNFEGVINADATSESVVNREQQAKSLVRPGCHTRLERLADGEWEYQ